MGNLPSAPSIGAPNVSNALPSSTAAQQNTAKVGNANPTVYPWGTPTSSSQNNSTSQPRFFFPVTIDGSRWDGLFPYRFVVIDTSKPGNPIVNYNSQNNNDSVTSDVYGKNGVFTIAFQQLSQQWVCQLPITPEQLNITDLFSITTSATLRGVIEEHNGVKFKTITASGTFGVWPSRQTVVNPPGTPSLVQSLFGGTLEALGNLQSSAQRVFNTINTGHPASKPTTVTPSKSPEGLASTGYYQAMFLQQFLEQYAEAKKIPANAGWRLVFDIPKQNQSFIVTPVQFVWQQTVNKPIQTLYTLQLKAWRRVDLKQKVSPAPPSIQTVSPGILQRILNTLTAAQQLCSSAISLIGAVTSDIEAPLEALRQTAMLVKDYAGIFQTAADLPFQLQTAFASAIGDAINTIQSINGLPVAASSNSEVAAPLAAIQQAYTQNEGLSMAAVANGQLGNAAAQLQINNPANTVFANPQANYALFSQVPVDNLVLSTAQQNDVDNALEAARALTVADLLNNRAIILKLALLLSNFFGSGDAYYNEIFGLPPPLVTAVPINIDQYEFLQSLYDVLQSYDILTATTQLDDNNIQSNMQYVAGLASEAGIEFTIPNSMILVPVPFGLTIEGIALRYLGDPQLWLDIVTLNNLKEPYIDEDGFQYPLLSNAYGRQITVGSNENLYIGQTVTLYSATQAPSVRTILGIDTLSSSSYLITLNGNPNLNNFTTIDQAYLQAYLPGTVNSQQKIYVPSNITPEATPTIVVPASTSVDPLTGLSQVDILLQSNGDIALNNYGDFRYSYGMTNIVQALQIKMGTVAGTVLLHPEFGVGIPPGTSNGSVNVQQIYSSINKQIQQDPRFAGLSNLNINLAGPKLSINMAVQLANQQGVFPITFQST